MACRSTSSPPRGAARRRDDDARGDAARRSSTGSSASASTTRRASTPTRRSGTNPHKLDWPNQPSPFRVFPDHPKVDLPTDAARRRRAGAVGAGGRARRGCRRQRTRTRRRTCRRWRAGCSWPTASPASGASGRHTFHLRSCPSSSALFPFEIYVAAFGVEGLEPGLYHYSVKEFALRKLRDGDADARADQEGPAGPGFLKTVPAALLVSTIFCRSTWRYRQRGYRYALLDAGHLVQNLVTAANGLGIQTTTRLSMNDRNTRELIGVAAERAVRRRRGRAGDGRVGGHGGEADREAAGDAATADADASRCRRSRAQPLARAA